MATLKSFANLIGFTLVLLLPVAWGQKPPLTLDEFFNAVDIGSVQISPDGHSVVIETTRPDWSANRFRHDLWLYRDDNGGSLAPLAPSGHDRSPQWSHDGHWIAFLSDRKTTNGEPQAAGDSQGVQVENDTAQLYVISPHGGGALRVTSIDEEIHAFTWSGDSQRIYFATRSPLTTAEKEVQREEWLDIIRFRESERGDVIFSVEVSSLLATKSAAARQAVETSVPVKLAAIPYRVSQMATSSNGGLLAIATDSPSERLESHDPYGIYVMNLASKTLHCAIHTQEGVDAIRWAPDSRHVFFTYEASTPEGPYQEETQTRLYWIDQTGDKAVRWASGFSGEVGVRYTADSSGDFAVIQDGSVVVAGRLGTEVQPYTQSANDSKFAKQPAWAGTYEMFSAARNSSRVAFVYSSLQSPREVYLAQSADGFQQAKPITAFNHRLTQHVLPEGNTYTWTADDGTQVEGILIYPPGKFAAKNLPMFTWIHGGPQMADGNEFHSPHAWAWFTLAATQGWLIFDPNYRGSTGYGDAFTLGFVPKVNSRSGKDILEGVDALVKEGIADPDRLAVGGYSNGGFLTNWLITQTTRFKAAVSGAGIVENVAMWGNSDAPVYFAYSLGGVPWETEANYNAEAAIWQMGKVTTPTLIISGSADTNTPAFESYLLERALYTRGVPHSLLIFPGESHSFDTNPWHTKIAVREELKWIDTYAKQKLDSR